MMTFVIAETKEDSLNWIYKDIKERQSIGQKASITEYCVVDSKERLVGVKNPEVVFLEGWTKRDDSRDIAFEIVVRSYDCRKN